VIVALPAVELLRNLVTPARETRDPPLLLMVALPAVEVLRNSVEPKKTLVMVALPAVELLKNCVKPGLRIPEGPGELLLLMVALLGR
jgi:hypothetical protein